MVKRLGIPWMELKLKKVRFMRTKRKKCSTTSRRAFLTVLAVKLWKGARGSWSEMIGEQRRGSTRRPLEWLEIGDMDMEGEGVITIIGEVGASTKVKGTTGEVDMVGVDRGWDREGLVE